MMFYYHIHPDYSIDATGEVDEFCKVALDVGLAEIAFTTHLDSDRVAGDDYVNVRGRRVDVAAREWFEDYETTIRTVGDTYKHQGLEVLLGIEVDCFPGVMDALPGEFFSTDFDFIIGSVHLIDHLAISAEGRAEQAFRKYSLIELGEKYYSLLCESIDLGIFDVLAHIDLYRRYGEGFYGVAIHDLWKPHLKELSKKMHSNGVGFEVNTSSFRRGMRQPMPEERIIFALREEGIKTVTVGSDAHRPSDVGKGISRALEILKRVGFDGPSSYRKRRAKIVPWDNLEKEN